MIKTVTMYSAGVCPFCQMAERLLHSKGVSAIDKIRVDLEPERRVEMMVFSSNSSRQFCLRSLSALSLTNS